MNTRVLHLPEHVLARLSETRDRMGHPDMEELVRAALWSFEQQSAEDRNEILRDCWDFGGLTRRPPHPTLARGGRISELVHAFVTKLGAGLLS
jgi:hypothetical protein